MAVILFGIAMFDNSVQPENAETPIFITLPSDGITLFLQPDMIVFDAVSIKQFPEE